jgi:hypothetical protein
MKYILFIFILPCIGFSQNVIPFVDFNNYFRSFQGEGSRIVEFQKIIDYKGGDEFVVYTDNKGNLRLFDGTTPKDLTNLNVEYQVSDHLLAWKIAGTVNLWDDGKLKTLTYNGRSFEVKDSIVVYEDLSGAFLKW